MFYSVFLITGSWNEHGQSLVFSCIWHKLKKFRQTLVLTDVSSSLEIIGTTFLLFIFLNLFHFEISKCNRILFWKQTNWWIWRKLLAWAEKEGEEWWALSIQISNSQSRLSYCTLWHISRIYSLRVYLCRPNVICSQCTGSRVDTEATHMMLFNGQVSYNKNMHMHTSMNGSEQNWQFISNKLVSTPEGGSWKSDKKINVNVKPLPYLTTWIYHRGVLKQKCCESWCGEVRQDYSPLPSTGGREIQPLCS